MLLGSETPRKKKKHLKTTLIGRLSNVIFIILLQSQSNDFN